MYYLIQVVNVDVPCWLVHNVKLVCAFSLFQFVDGLSQLLNGLFQLGWASHPSDKYHPSDHVGLVGLVSFSQFV